MRVVGLDLSLTATGIADENGAWPPFKTEHRGMARLVVIRNAVMHAAVFSAKGSPTLADLVVIEGYSMGGQRGASGVGQMMGELGGVVRLALYEAGIAFVNVPPSSLKKFATGKGNANKDAVLVAAVRAGFEGDDNNAADAWWLRQMGLYAVTQRDYSLGLAGGLAVRPAEYRNEAVAKVTWPAVPGSFDFDAPPHTIDTASL